MRKRKPPAVTNTTVNTITPAPTPCPSCGHCPTCGRSAQPVTVTPYVPWYPASYPYVPTWGPVWIGGLTTTSTTVARSFDSHVEFATPTFTVTADESLLSSTGNVVYG